MEEYKLFGEQDASSFFEQNINEIKNEIMSKSNDYTLNVNVEEWRNYFVGEYDYL